MFSFLAHYSSPDFMVGGEKLSNTGTRFDIKSQPEIRRCPSLLSWKQGREQWGVNETRARTFLQTGNKKRRREKTWRPASSHTQIWPAPLHPSESVMLFCLLESSRARNWMSSQTQSPGSVEHSTGLTFKYRREEGQHTQHSIGFNLW